MGYAKISKKPADSLSNGKSLLRVLKNEDPVFSKNEVIL
jgi:hypothetical protein